MVNRRGKKKEKKKKWNIAFLFNWPFCWFSNQLVAINLYYFPEFWLTWFWQLCSIFLCFFWENRLLELSTLPCLLTSSLFLFACFFFFFSKMSPADIEKEIEMKQRKKLLLHCCSTHGIHFETKVNLDLQNSVAKAGRGVLKGLVAKLSFSLFPSRHLHSSWHDSTLSQSPYWSQQRKEV